MNITVGGRLYVLRTEFDVWQFCAFLNRFVGRA